MPPFRSRARLSVRPLEGRDVPNGTITASLSATGLLTLTGDDDDNQVTIQLNAGNVVLTPDPNTTVDDLAVPGTGTNGAIVTITGTVTSIKANLLGGADVLAANPTSPFGVTGPVAVNLGDGNNQLNLSTTGLVTLGGLTYTGGDGSDDVTVGGGAGSAIGGMTKITVSHGGGTTALTGIGFSAVTYTAGEEGATPNAVTGTNLNVTGTFSAALGNSFPATLDFTGSTLGGLKASGYSLTSVLTNTAVNTNAAYKATFGAAVFGDGLTVTKNLTVTAANASLFGINAGAIVVGGNLAITGTAATTVLFGTTALSNVKGNITVKGGPAADTFGANSNFKADKMVSLTLNGGDNAVSIGDGSAAVAIGGKVSVKTGDGDDTVFFDRVTVTGGVSLSTKGGADVLSVEEGSRFQSTFAADLGNGDDTITIAQNTGTAGPPPVPGPVTFVGKATIKAGAGNDLLELGLAPGSGGDANSAVVFSDATSVVDGGLGLNFFDALTSQFLGAAVLNW